MRFVIVLLCALLVGCAQDVRARFPDAPPPELGAATGSLVLLLGHAAGDVTVAIDGRLVVAGEHTARVVIDGVPVGTREVVVAANGGDKELRVWIDSAHATTVPIGVPDSGAGFVQTLVGSILTIVVYSLLHR